MLNPLRDYIERRRLRTEGPRAASTGPSADASTALDPKATFRRAPGEEWTFDGQHILLNGHEADALLEPGEGDIGAWCALVDALGEYRDWAHVHQSMHRERLNHVIGGLQERALLQLRRVYEERMGGLAFAWGDGQFLLNNINVRAMLAMYHVRPTQKARRFLEGLRSKLALILCNQTASPHVARAQTIVRAIYDEVCTSLATPAADTLCLPAGDRHCLG